MLTAQEAKAQLTAPRLDDGEIDKMLDAAAKSAVDAGRFTFTVTIPRHSIRRAAELATAAGWSTEINAVRSPSPDAPDRLICSTSGGAR